MLWWKWWDSSCCPCCQSVDETTEHVLLCPHHTSSDTWNQQFIQLQQWLIQSGTDPTIQGCLLSSLEHWNNWMFYSCASPLCGLAAQDQDQISFFGLMVGRLPTKWINIQDTYYHSVGSPHSASFGCPTYAINWFWFHMLCGCCGISKLTIFFDNRLLTPPLLTFVINSLKGCWIFFPKISFMSLQALMALPFNGYLIFLLMTNNCGSMPYKMPELRAEISSQFLRLAYKIK